MKKINSKYFQQLLNKTSNIPQKSKDFIQKVIDAVKGKGDQGTEVQYKFLKRLETGNWDFGTKNENIETKPIVKPTTKPEIKPKRRTLSPPKEAPNTRPKAIAENEKAIVNKISNRFKNLSK
jgi:hypothetical protein